MVSDNVMVKALHTLDNIVMSAIGATVFIFGLVHNTQVSTELVEYVATYGMYFGVHVFSSNSASKKAINATNTPPKA